MNTFLTADQFRRQYAPAFGETWTEAEHKLLNNPHDKAIIDQLTSAAIAGLLREPVRVHIGDEHDPQHRVINGMHRVIACARAGVPVEHTWEPEPEPVNGYLETRIVLPFMDATQVDMLFPALRSFMIDRNWWASSDMMSTSNEVGNTVAVCVYWIPDNATVEEFRDALILGVRKQLLGAFLPDCLGIETLLLDGNGEPA